MRHFFFFFVLLPGWLMSAAPSLAFGALAVGVPDDVAKEGIAQGYSGLYATPEEAQQSALIACRELTDNKIAISLCHIVTTFNAKCVALSLDPKPGTPGHGWGIGNDKDAAEKSALSMCYSTAGGDRKQFCKEALKSICDR